MSGGYFNHAQLRLLAIADSIENELSHIDNPNTLEEFKVAIEKLKEAHVYVQRIDWYLSGDDSEETFHERLNDELNKLIN